MNKPKNKIVIVLAFFAIYVIWGSTYLLNKIAVTELPAFMLASIRFIVSSFIIFSIAKTLKIPIKISRKQFFNTAIAGSGDTAVTPGYYYWDTSRVYCRLFSQSLKTRQIADNQLINSF